MVALYVLNGSTLADFFPVSTEKDEPCMLQRKGLTSLRMEVLGNRCGHEGRIEVVSGSWRWGTTYHEEQLEGEGQTGNRDPEWNASWGLKAAGKQLLNTRRKAVHAKPSIR